MKNIRTKIMWSIFSMALYSFYILVFSLIFWLLLNFISFIFLHWVVDQTQFLNPGPNLNIISAIFMSIFFSIVPLKITVKKISQKDFNSVWNEDSRLVGIKIKFITKYLFSTLFGFCFFTFLYLLIINPKVEGNNLIIQGAPKFRTVRIPVEMISKISIDSECKLINLKSRKLEFYTVTLKNDLTWSLRKNDESDKFISTLGALANVPVEMGSQAHPCL